MARRCHEKLADGDTSAPIPATKARDEIGEMARSDRVPRHDDQQAFGRRRLRTNHRPGAAQRHISQTIEEFALGRNRTRQVACGIDEARNEFVRSQQDRRHRLGKPTPPNSASLRLPKTSPRPRVRSKNWRRHRSANRVASRNRPTLPTLLSRRRNAPSSRCSSWAKRPPASAGVVGLIQSIAGQPTFWRLTPPLKRHAPAKPAELRGRRGGSKITRRRPRRPPKKSLQIGSIHRRRRCRAGHRAGQQDYH